MQIGRSKRYGHPAPPVSTTKLTVCRPAWTAKCHQFCGSFAHVGGPPGEIQRQPGCHNVVCCSQGSDVHVHSTSSVTFWRPLGGGALLRQDELATVLVEVEAIPNSRPNVADGSNPNDGGAITPAHLPWKSLRDSYRYHCKVAVKKRRSGSAGGIGPEQPKAKDEVDEINPSTSQGNFGEQNLDDSSCSLSSTMEFEPIQLDADASTSLEVALYSYATPNERRKVEKAKPKSEEVINMLENVMAKQEEILKSSDLAPIRTIVRYWDEALRDMDPEQAKEMEQAMTQVLWQHQAA
ncbi:hypothetical protein ACLKA6_019803 [Drosophila palustris]